MTPYNGDRAPSVVFEIERGETLNKISSKLEALGLISSKRLFKFYSFILGKKKSYKSGNYLVKGSVSIYHLVQVLDEGRFDLVKFTIREGLRTTEIAEILKSNKFQNQGKYLDLMKDQNFIKSLNLPVEVKSLEGFLYPDTYMIAPQSTEKTLLRAMTDNFLKKIPKNYGEMAKKAGLSYYDAVNLASIIEKETGNAAERTIISSVFHNRLRKGMKLQSDPTVIYGIENFDGNIKRRQLRKRTDFNTYVILGLPKTPIANPGLESLMAAVKPDNTNYLYFVGMGNGRHKFSKTYKEHDQAVSRYQKRPVKNYRSY